MVKLGSNLSDKPEKQPPADDGFDNIPLITPLEVNQLQQPYTEKVMVKTTVDYQPLQQQKKKKPKNHLYIPGIKKLNIKFYDEVSERVKLTGLILITLGFLACLVLLVMYKALWYDQLTCPEGFVLKKIPEVLWRILTHTPKKQPSNPDPASASTRASNPDPASSNPDSASASTRASNPDPASASTRASNPDPASASTRASNPDPASASTRASNPDPASSRASNPDPASASTRASNPDPASSRASNPDPASSRA